MSIIYGTLERLEAASVEGGKGEAEPVSLASRRQSSGSGVALRLGLVAVLVVSGLVSWRYLHAESAALAVMLAGVLVDAPQEPVGYSVKPEEVVRQESTTQTIVEVAEQRAPEHTPDPVSHTTAPAMTQEPESHALAAVPAATPAPETVASVTTAAPVVEQQPVTIVTAMEVVQPGMATLAVAPQPDGVTQVVEQARSALSRGDYSAALSVLKSLPQAPQDRADFWLVKGSAQLALGMLEAAEASLQQSHTLAPGNAQVAVQLAIVQQEKDDHSAALQILAVAAQEHAHVPEIFLNMGYSQLALGAESQARRSFRTFMQLTRHRSLYQQQRTALERWLQQESLAQR